MKNDKIFDNNFDSPDFELNGQIKFDLDPSMEDSRPQEEQIHYEIIARKIHDLIQNSRFNIFNVVDDLGHCIKLKKADINDVYGFIIDELVANYSRIDLYSELCVYFDIKPEKFYSSLSNVYKEDLIQELDIRTGVLDRKNIKKLF